MSKKTNDILGKIKESGIKPKPRWQFVLVNFLLIVAVIISVVLGGFVMSLIFLKLFNLEWEFVSIAGERGLPPIFEVLPLLWIALLLVVLFLSVWAFEKTDGGYKYSPVWVVVGSIFVSMLLGGVFYVVNGAETANKILRSSLPAYEKWEERGEKLFYLPERGALPGKVIEIESDSNFWLIDLERQKWNVQIVPESLAQKKIRELKAGQMVFVVGERKEPNVFEAKDLRFKCGMAPNLKEDIVRRTRGGMGANLMRPARPSRQLP